MLIDKILYLTPGCFDKGGISRYCRYQIRALREEFGAESVRVLSLRGPDNSGFEEPFETYFHGPRGDLGLGSRAQFAAYFSYLALTWRPRIIHSAHVNFSPLVTRIGRWTRCHTVLNVYGLELWGALSQARRSAMAHYDTVISDCHATADFVQRHDMHRDDPAVIWDCVDLERFRPGSIDRSLMQFYGLPDPSSHKIVMSLGRLAKGAQHKGFDRLIKNFALFAREESCARLVIGGQGDDRPRLEAIAAENNLQGKVVFAGPVKEEHLPDFYRYADVFSLVSDFGVGRGEGIPLTPLEAMACGVPVIVGNEDGSREAVVNNRNGRIISPRNQDQHVQAIAELLQVGGVALSNEARAVAEERFSYSAFKGKHRELYDSISRNQQ